MRNVTSDRKIYRFLHPGFDRVSAISGGGKGARGSTVEVISEISGSID